MRLTYPTALVLQALAAGSRYGFDVSDATGLPTGTVYPILRRLDREGLVVSRWEPAADARREQRPPRRYYRLTSEGERTAEAAVSRYRSVTQVQQHVPLATRPVRAT